MAKEYKSKFRGEEIDDLLAKIKDGGSSGYIETTYAKLKTLRDDGKLIAGGFYRITDYECFTSQEYTVSANHPFDIIVFALDEKTISEDARAIQRDGDDYFADTNLAAWKLRYSLDNNTDRFSWVHPIDTTAYKSDGCQIKPDLIQGNEFVTPFTFVSCVWVDNANDSDYKEGTHKDLEENLIYEWGYVDEQLCLYKSNPNLYEDEGGVPDYDDKYLYRGVITVDGNEYDYWQKWDAGYNDGAGGLMPVYAMTERIVKNPADYSEEDVTLEAKGVVYRMIDEYDNDCPYDFKNIMFTRFHLEVPTADDIIYSWQLYMYADIKQRVFADDLAYMWSGLSTHTHYWFNDGDTYIFSSWSGRKENFYTFSYVNSETGEIRDASMEHGAPCLGNKICSIGNNLNNIVLFGYDFSDNNFAEGCECITIGVSSQNNKFGLYCNGITLGEGCVGNEFGNDNSWIYLSSYANYNSFHDNATAISFGDYSSHNIVKSGCGSIALRPDCSYNVFGLGCSRISLEFECSSNMLGHYCSNIELNQNCGSNILGDACTGIFLAGLGSSHNEFGTECSNIRLTGDSLGNRFGIRCHYIAMGNNSCNNTFGNSCERISFRRSDEWSYDETAVGCIGTGPLCDYVKNVRVGDGSHDILLYVGDDTISENFSINDLVIAQGCGPREMNSDGYYEPIVKHFGFFDSYGESRLDVDHEGNVKLFRLLDLLPQ